MSGKYFNGFKRSEIAVLFIVPNFRNSIRKKLTENYKNICVKVNISISQLSIASRFDRSPPLENFGTNCLSLKFSSLISKASNISTSVRIFISAKKLVQG